MALEALTEKELDKIILKKGGGIKYQIQYVDHDDDQWTVPLHVINLNTNKLFDDLSISKIKLIFDDGSEKTFIQ